MLALSEPTQDKWGAVGTPLCFIDSMTVSNVRSRVEPPAPKVTEKNSGSSSASLVWVFFSFSTPLSVLGGKNSKLKRAFLFMVVVLVSSQSK